MQLCVQRNLSKRSTFLYISGAECNLTFQSRVLIISLSHDNQVG